MFTKYPIVVRVVDTKRSDRTYIFLGDAPEHILSEVKKVLISNRPDSKDRKNQKLESFYGKHWRRSLGMDLSTSSREGGDSDLLDISEIISETGRPVAKPAAKPAAKPIRPTEPGKYVIVTDVCLYPEDRISEFKEKISLATGIPMFKQHLYSKSTGPLNYRIICDTVVHIDIERPGDTKILGLPMDMNLYQHRDSCVVEGTDWFTTIGDIYMKHNVRHFNLYNIDNYTSEISSELAELSRTDTYQFQLIYYAFVVKYWPLLSLNAFATFVTDPNDMTSTYPDMCANMDTLRQKYTAESQTLNRKYQLLMRPPADLAKYAPEQAVVSDSNLKKSNSNRKIIDVAIRGAMLASEVYYTHSMMAYIKVNIRNLFEKIHVDASMPFIRANLLCDTGPVLLTKVQSPMLMEGDPKDTSRVFEKIKYKIQMPNFNTLLIAIPADDLFLIFTLDQHGKYQIRSAWGEEIQVDFATVFAMAEKYVNPVIEKINALGRGVFDSANKLPIISRATCKFTGLSLSLFYKMPMSLERFGLLGDLLKRDLNSGILKTSPETPEINTFEYQLLKGMTNYDKQELEQVYANTNNYYDYLSNAKIKQKWMQLFGQGRTIRFIFRSTDVKIEIQDLREKEFTYFYEYIISLLYEFEHTKVSGVKHKHEEVKTNRLKLLKSKDPELYTFKQFGSDVVFSRICQKEHQPLMYEPEELTSLSKDMQNKAVKFWNYTTNRPVYYVCTNPAFPYLNFLVGYHPKGYCLPCCKKTQAEDIVVSNSKKNTIYHTCMEQHKYTEADTQVKSSRHIMNYGKIVDVGRIGNLPDIIAKYVMYNLEYLETRFSTTETNHKETIKGGGVMKKSGYYLYGVSQNSAVVSNIGAGHAIAAALDMSFSEFIEASVTYFRKYSGNLDYFKILYNGELGTFFTGLAELLQHMYELFVDNTVRLQDSVKKFPGWNELFAELSELCFGKRILLFDDTSIDITGTSTKAHKIVENIEFVIPNSDISAETLDANDIIPKDMQYIILLRKKKKSKVLFSSNHIYYPVFVFIPQMYFRNMHIEKKTFAGTDEIVQLFRNAIDNSIQKHDSTGSITSRTVYDYVSFLSGKVGTEKKCKILRYYMNSRDLCYAVLIGMNSGKSDKSSKQFVWPVGYSHFREDALATYETYSRKDSTVTFSELKQLLQHYNNWSLLQSEAAGRYQINPETSAYKSQWNQRECNVTPIHAFVKIDRFLGLVSQTQTDTDQIIGFISNDLYYYFAPVSMSEKRYAALLQESMQSYALLAEHFKKIKAQYSVYYLQYDPDTVNAALHSNTHANAEHVSKLHKGLYDKYVYYMYVVEIISYLDRERNKKIRSKLRDILSGINTKNPEDMEETYQNLKQILSEDDMEKIKSRITLDKSQILNYLDSDTFEFDRITLSRWKQLGDAGNTDELRKDVLAVTRLVTFVSSAAVPEHIPNVFVPCSDSSESYCKNNKLVIKTEDLNWLVDLLVNDLCNSLKRDYLLSSIIMQNTKDNFVFTRKKGEEIYIRTL